ncbi:3-hydroxyacyl-CoA dehydrogenase family protein [uncultured Ilyobacter sp.]|uniref:3-hydroxyacyl-CoA dehydrogenase family protein n=1 Tax=uncultured Ilyobacter sp. TaxID=544433 RepID=UPI002AA8A9ED|nr:3-hydroxyacyl-CoA dehydrogenase family protein [uncultured Ilyobacter sp.]
MKNITVVGAGTMGHGIAEAFAIHGYNVNLFDLSAEALKKAVAAIREELSILAREKVIKIDEIDEIIGRITLCEDLESAAKESDYIIESVLERLDIKKSLFKELDQLAPAEAIFASNTSSLKLSDMISEVSEKRKKNCIINHWYNPPHIMPIAELTFFGDTSQETYDKVEKLYKSIGKQIVKVLKEVDGLVANRIQQAVAREVFSLIEMEVAEPADIDRALKFGPAFRYCSTGQLEIADFGGLDIWKIVGDNLLAVMDNTQKANPLLEKKVEEGKLGLKSGEGFYKYEGTEAAKTAKEAYTIKLLKQLKVSKDYI